MMFVTTIYGVLDINTGHMTFSNAGHNHPHIIRQGGEVETLTHAHGMAIGVMDEIIYQEDSITLNPGDTLFLYTDGVTEAEKKDGTQYTDSKLIENLQKNHDLAASELVNTIRSDITEFAQGWPQSDDITILVIRYLVRNQN